MAQLTLEQAQEVVTKLYLTLAGWKQQRQIFVEKLQIDKENQVVKQMLLMLDACTSEVEEILRDVQAGKDPMGDLLHELKQLIEKYDGE